MSQNNIQLYFIYAKTHPVLPLIPLGLPTWRLLTCPSWRTINSTAWHWWMRGLAQRKMNPARTPRRKTSQRRRSICNMICYNFANRCDILNVSSPYTCVRDGFLSCFSFAGQREDQKVSWSYGSKVWEDSGTDPGDQWTLLWQWYAEEATLQLSKNAISQWYDVNSDYQPYRYKK